MIAFISSKNRLCRSHQICCGLCRCGYFRSFHWFCLQRTIQPSLCRLTACTEVKAVRVQCLCTMGSDCKSFYGSVSFNLKKHVVAVYWMSFSFFIPVKQASCPAVKNIYFPRLIIFSVAFLMNLADVAVLSACNPPPDACLLISMDADSRTK